VDGQEIGTQQSSTSTCGVECQEGAECHEGVQCQDRKEYREREESQGARVMECREGDHQEPVPVLQAKRAPVRGQSEREHISLGPAEQKGRPPKVCKFKYRTIRVGVSVESIAQIWSQTWSKKSGYSWIF